MGFEVPRKVFRLRFEEYPDLEVDVQEMPIGMLFGMLAAADGFDEDRITPADMPKLRALMGEFAVVLHSWNFTDDGKPVPATAEGLLSLPLSLSLRILKLGLEEIVRVPPPLPEGSGNGASPPEASLPMEPLPASQPS